MKHGPERPTPTIRHAHRSAVWGCIFFIPGDPDGRIKCVEKNQVKVKVTLHPAESGVESKVAIRRGTNIEPNRYKPSRFVAEICLAMWMTKG